MFDDLRYSLRALAKHPSFLVAGVVVLGLAVGVNTAVFSLINALLLRPLPVRAPQELGFVYLTTGNPSIPYSWYLELEQKTDTFSGIAARRDDRARLRLADDALPIQGESVSANYFDLLGIVSGGYFSAMGIPLLRGRTFDARESDEQPKTAIVSAALADDLWPGEDPIGEWFAQHDPGTALPPRWLEVVGVVGSVTLPLEETPRAAYYIPVESQPLSASIIVLRGRGNAAQLTSRVKQAIGRAEGSAIVAQARPLVETVNALRYPRRFTAAILSASGLAGLLLAALGVFALMSYAVAQRVGEIGVRMVLGADRRDVARLVLSDGASVVIAGIVVGFGLSFSIIRYASHAIVPLPDADAPTFIVVPLVLVAMVLLACVLPARRAARVDPLVVLRNS